MATVQAKTLASIDRALRRAPWREVAWPERSRRVATAMLATLRDGLGSLPAATAWAAACGAARAELPVAPGPWHQRHAHAVLVWSVRSLLAAVESERDVFAAEGLERAAVELAEVCGRVPETNLTVDADATVERVRDALRGGETEGYAALVRQQCATAAALFVVGGHDLDGVLRGAVERADLAWQRKGGVGIVAQRRAWARLGVAEVAWALAETSMSVGEVPGEAATALWLAQRACAVAARVDRAEAWVKATAVVASDETETKTEAPRAPEKKTEKAMDNTKITPVLKTLETDAGDAAWRTAGSQFVKLARDPIVALLSRHLAPDDASARARIAGFLETELGAALLSGVLSAALMAMPQNDVTAKLGRELRVRAMAGAGDVVADLLTGPLRQVAVLFLQGQPAAQGSASADPAGLPGAAVIDALRVAANADATAHAEA